MMRYRSYFRIAFASPICPARVRTSVICLPSPVDEGALLHLLQVRLVVDADDGDLVVSEQFPFDRLAERQAMEYGPEHPHVIHRGDFEIGGLCCFSTLPVK